MKYSDFSEYGVVADYAKQLSRVSLMCREAMK